MDLKSKWGIVVLLLLLCRFTVTAQPAKEFVSVAAGRYIIGKKEHMLNPRRQVRVENFSIASTETTNQQFAAFIKATGYKTDAERLRNAMVFQPGLREFEWLEDSTACWRFPNGISRGGIENKMNHPVTCISYTDILAYCKWAGVRLPTLDEWEVACRAGSTTDYFFGSANSTISKYANIWKGKNHLVADTSDGYLYTSPVASFAPNAWGLYDMYGNVFEFCSGKLPTDKSTTIAHARGGSWWCSRNSCNFFNSYDIGRVNIHASFSNQGFRVVKYSKLRITDTDSVIFRRSYARDTPLPDKELEALQKKDPNTDHAISTQLRDRLNVLGLMHKDSLTLSKFKLLNSFELHSEPGGSIKVYTGYAKDHSAYYITAVKGSDSATIVLTQDIQEVKFALADVIPGGFKELIVLRNYYIMNGDNYEIHIYEVHE